MSQSGAPIDTRLLWLGRIGYTSRAIVYIVAGILAWAIATGRRKEKNGAGTTDALDMISGSTFGNILVIIICIGLIFFGIWRWLEAVYDPANIGKDAKAWVKRVGFAISGTLYLALGITELISQGGQGNSGGNSSGNGNSNAGGNGGGGGGGNSWTKQMTSTIVGQVFVGIVGCVIMIKGVYNLYKACTKKFVDKLNLTGVSESSRKKFVWIGQAGLFSKFVADTLFGVFVLIAAIQSKKKDQSMVTFLVDQPYGPALLAIVATCIIMYGIFNLILAKYRDVFRDNRIAQSKSRASTPDHSHTEENV